MSLADLFDRVNREVNFDVRYRTDMDLYDDPEFWTVIAGKGEGDCDDYALTKRFRLLNASVPLDKLRLAIVFTETQEGRNRARVKKFDRDDWMTGDHAVLIARDEKTDWVLDNRHPTLMRMSDTGYELDRIQVAGKSEWRHGILPGIALQEVAT